MDKKTPSDGSPPRCTFWTTPLPPPNCRLHRPCIPLASLCLDGWHWPHSPALPCAVSRLELPPAFYLTLRSLWVWGRMVETASWGAPLGWIIPSRQVPLPTIANCRTVIHYKFLISFSFSFSSCLFLWLGWKPQEKSVCSTPGPHVGLRLPCTLGRVFGAHNLLL